MSLNPIDFDYSIQLNSRENWGSCGSRGIERPGCVEGNVEGYVERYVGERTTEILGYLMY
jgi:hypothetical protein